MAPPRRDPDHRLTTPKGEQDGPHVHLPRSWPGTEASLGFIATSWHGPTPGGTSGLLGSGQEVEHLGPEVGVGLVVGERGRTLSVLVFR